ncbi:MAG: hypothetical protein ACREOO_11030 [bacterium]
MRTLCLTLIAFACVPIDGTAQMLAPPSWSKKLNARTVFISTGWQYEMELAKPAHLIAALQISSQTDWEDPTRSAAALSVSIDGRLCSHVVTYMGREFHHYEVHLGLVTPGVRVLEITRLDSMQIDVKLLNVHVDAYEEDHPQYAVLAHAPVIFGRKEMRHSDVPLLMAYDLRWFDAPAGSDAHAGASRRMKSIEYTVVYSNEAGGTPPVGLLHVWGRYADIEWVYRVEFETDGKTRRRAYFQGQDHKPMPFRGGFENDQPALQVATLNNMLIDTLNTKLRFALPPRFTMPDEGLRERLMLQAPWTWRVCAKEARREQRQEKMLSDSTRLADLKHYLFIQFAAHPQNPEAECGGFFIAKFRRQTGESVSHLWSPRLVIRSRKPFIRQTALPMPAGTTPEDLVRLDFVADAYSQKTVLTEIVNLFALDGNDLPRLWPPGWKGAIALDPGERVRFYIDDFQMLPERTLPLAEIWSFKADSLQRGDEERWNETAVNDESWPLLRPGVSWERQGHAGYRGVAWYRTYFKPEQSWRGEKMWLGLGEIAGDYAVWLNGKPLRAANFPETTEEALAIFDLTPHAQIGKANALAIRVDGHEQPGGLLARPLGIKNLQQAISQPLLRAMVDPKIDESEPFDYFAQPSAFLGTLENGVSAQITPEGSLYTGEIEFTFYGGAAPQPLLGLKKTLLQDHLPVINYRAAQDGVDYRFEAFALPIADTTANQAMNYLQVTLINNSSTPRSTRFAVGMRFRGGEQRARAQTVFDPLWHYRLVGKFVHRNQEVLCSVSALPGHVQFSPLGTANQPESIVGMMEYRFSLAPGEIQRVSLCVPQKPISSERMRAAQGLTFDCDRLREDAVRFWQKFLQKGATLSVAEDKVNRLWQSQLIYNAILFGPGAAQDPENSWYQLPLSLESASVRAFDAAGYHELARQTLRAGVKRMGSAYGPANGHVEKDQIDQSVASRAKMMAALGEHVQITNDRALLSEALPALRAAVQGFEKKRKENSSRQYRAQEVPLALLGLKHARNLAELAGDQQLAASADKLYATVEKDFRSRLEAFKKKKGDGDNALMKREEESMIALAVYPAELLPASDKRAGSALPALRGNFEEGVACRSGQWLDADFTFDLAHAALQTEAEEIAAQDLYALLVHTTATHLIIGDKFYAWGNRQNQEKSGEFQGVNGKFITLLRDMLMRAEGRDLHVFEAVPPAWCLNENRLEIHNVVTALGTHSLQATISAEKLIVDFQHNWRMPSKRLLFHIPEFAEVLAARVDGQAIALDKGHISVPPLTRRLEIQWRNHAAQQRMSYANAVADFRREYAGRYEMWKKEYGGKD